MFIVNIRSFLNLGPLTQRHTGIQVKHTAWKTSRMSKLHGAKECAKSSIMAFDDPGFPCCKVDFVLNFAIFQT